MKKLSTALLALAALLSLSSVALIVSVSADPTAQEKSNIFIARLSGDQLVPPITTDVTGQANFQLEDETHLDFTLNLVNVNPDSPHRGVIHCAPAGENGPSGVTLFFVTGLDQSVEPPEDILFVSGQVTTPNTDNECGWADLAAVVDAMRSGYTYVEVENILLPEVRGQIETAAQE